MSLATYQEDQSNQPAFKEILGLITVAKQRVVDVVDRGEEA